MVHVRKGFTLIELLIVIGMLAILAAVVILLINPVEILKESRDSRRLSDLETLNKALGIVESTIAGADFGNDNTVYLSVPSSDTDCGFSTGNPFNLPALPSGGSPPWTYHCASQTDYRNINGTGWVPVNFTPIPPLPTGQPFAVLPIDPVNDAAQGLYYTYVKGSWKLTANLESAKYLLSKSATDGGVVPLLFETGNDLKKPSPEKGLVGYWKFDESAAPLTDSSGYGNNGTPVGSPGIGVPGKIGNAVSFALTADDYINVGDITIAGQNWSNLTVGAWINWDGEEPDYAGVYHKSSGGDMGRFLIDPSGRVLVQNGNGSFLSSNAAVIEDQWAYITYVYDSSQEREFIYVNGVLKGQQSRTGSISENTDGLWIGRGHPNITYSYGGLIDEFRVYNRALSATEVQAIYTAGQ